MMADFPLQGCRHRSHLPLPRELGEVGGGCGKAECVDVARAPFSHH